jgi:hypothetical protein
VVVGTIVVVVVVVVMVVVIVVEVVVVESRGESVADAGITSSHKRIPALSVIIANRRSFKENSGNYQENLMM